MNPFALVLAAALPAGALFGGDARPALLWIPNEPFSDWSNALTKIEKAGLQLTIAVSPSMLTPQAAPALVGAVAGGKIELALRLDGDPILPLVAGHAEAPRPQDAFARLAQARGRFRAALGQSPAGFVPGAGALDPSMLPALPSLGFSWAAAGEYVGSAPETPWAQASGKSGQPCLVVPMAAVRTDGADPLPEDLPSGSAAWDEASGLAPDGSFLRALDILSSRRNGPVGALAAARRDGAVDAMLVASWPTWAGTLDAWTEPPEAQRAWQLYGEAAAAVEKYQNSGSADLQALEEANEALYKAQDGWLYRLAGSADPAVRKLADRRLRERLRSVYKRLKQSAPERLFAGGSAPEAGDAGEPDEATGLRATHGAGWLQVDNPRGTFALSPSSAAFGGASVAADAWKILNVRAEWDSRQTTLLFRMKTLVPSPSQTGQLPELGRLLLEAYIDLNGVVGAGSTYPLHGRAAFIPGRDAWEYALSISARGALLFRSNPSGSPRLAARLSAAADPATGEVRVSLPAAVLRGNPLRWGYVVLGSALDPAAPEDAPRALPAERGGGLLGLLAPLEQQQTLLNGKGRRRLAAARVN